jgi:SP family general alpha glucoside:H+ symporter-like MFS transporter
MEDTTQHIGITAEQAAALSEASIDPVLLREGQDLAEREKTTPIGTVFRSHWRGALWSLCLSFALVMDGFDGGLIGSFFGHPAFQRRFGELQSDGSYLISANWQTAITNCMTAGNLIGLCITGACQERFGSKKTYIGGMILITGFIFIPVFATSIGVLLAGCLLMAIPWGIFNVSGVPETDGRMSTDAP